MNLVSDKGKDLIAQWEGVSSTEYLDSGGEATIGVGHLLTKAERLSGKIRIGNEWIDYRHGLTDYQVDSLLEQDLGIAIRAVNELVDVGLSQDQFDALVSFVYNVGVEAFKNSTLLKLLNRGDYSAVPAQLKRWVYDNGKIVQGLINRRQKEIDLWNGIRLIEV